MATPDNTRSKTLPVGVHTQGGLKQEPPLSESDPTNGYRFNHCMLRIRDPEPTLHFHVDLMGMRTIFALNTGPITVCYLGYPQSAEHRANPALFAQETAPHSAMTQTLELCHYHGTERDSNGYISTGNDPPHLGFSHLGVTVPNVADAVQRLRRAGVKVAKDVGEGPNEAIPITKWEMGQKGIATEDLDPKFLKIINQIAFVEDPVSPNIDLQI